MTPPAAQSQPLITVENLTMAYEGFVVQRDLNFTIRRGEVFVVMGDSGCGKSTLLRSLVGLLEPTAGRVLYGDVDFWALSPQKRQKQMRRWGVLFQGGALWSSMSLRENIALPLKEHTQLDAASIDELVHLKLSLVGLGGFEDFYPSELSGGMRKRAGLARAMALDPDILFFDEPSAGLDPISAKRLDELILNIRESLGTTIVVVTHELASIYAIATDSIFLDSDTRTMLASGQPRLLRENPTHPKLKAFLHREDYDPNEVSS
ncbi:MAG: ATP-binding cassette domain-containing protein [Phycisphaerales bacterium]|nr:ATP-binding cassette domain-containing protein [Phycisphaerales bacterium]